nr:hypothetical protein [uncultured Alistipes sp.]
MNNTVIVTTPAQLREIVADEVAAILPKLADFRRKNEPVETDGMTVDDAARFLTEQGIPTTRATLYNLVYKIPSLTVSSDAARCSRKKSFLRGLNRAPSILRTGGPLPHCVSPKVPTVNNRRAL